MISVCMATYNGKDFVLEQIMSILGQIGSEDEIIVVDDCSSDNTVKIIEEIGDPRIKITSNDKNIGVVKSFERAIERSAGEYIFLSDQDDIWFPTKVEKVLSALENSNSDLCLTDAEILLENGKLGGRFLATRGSSRSILGVIYKNFFIGCCIAFKSDLKDKILPFPPSIDMHDQWIGITALMNSGITLINEPLMYYRRHGSNVTQMSRSGALDIISKRMGVIRMIAVSKYRKKVTK